MFKRILSGLVPRASKRQKLRYSQSVRSTKRRRQIEALEARAMLAADYELYDIDQAGAPTYGRTAVVGTNMFYWDIAPDKGVELFKLDTLTDTASLYMDINPGIGSSFTVQTNITGFAVHGSKLYFEAYRASDGNQIRWIDVSASTPTIKTVSKPNDLQSASTLLSVANRIYFVGAYDGLGTELRWFDTNSSAPTVQTIDVNDGDGNSLDAYGHDMSRLFALSSNKLYFKAFDAQHGDTLRWIDVTSNNPVVNTIDVGPNSHHFDFTADDVVLAGNRLFFSAYNDSIGDELRWIDVNEDDPEIHSFDFSPGIAFQDVLAGSDAGVRGFKAVGNKLFFTAKDAGDVTDVRWLDYTQDDPEIKSLDALSSNYSIEALGDVGFTLIGDKLYFVANQSDLSKWVWIDTTSDAPSIHATDIVYDSSHGFTAGLTALVGDQLYFAIATELSTGLGLQLMHIDASANASASNPFDLSLGQYVGYDYPFDMPAFTVVGSKLYFAAQSSDSIDSEFSLISLDTTDQSIVSIDISSSVNARPSQDYVQVGDKLFFNGSAYEGSTLHWINAGQNVRTVSSLDVYMNKPLGSVGSKFFFVGTEDRSNPKIYWVDASPATLELHALNVLEDSSSAGVSEAIVVGDKLIVDIFGEQTHAMKMIDASSDQPTVKDIDFPRSDDSALAGIMGQPIAVGSVVYFTNYDPQAGAVLRWFDTTDPQLEVGIRDIGEDLDEHPSDFVTRFVLAGDKLYFTAHVMNDDTSLNWIDTTAATPVINRVVSLGLGDLTRIEHLKVVGDRLFFLGEDARSGAELRWIDSVADPSVFNTIELMVGDVSSIDFSYYHDEGIAVVGNKLFFTAYDATHGTEPRWIDLAPSSPILFGIIHTIDVEVGDQSSLSEGTPFTVVGTRMYFAAYREADGSEVRWIDASEDDPHVHTIEVFDGPRDSTFDLHTLIVGDRLYFDADDAEYGSELRWFDATSATPEVHTVDLRNGPDASRAFILSNYYFINGRIYLAATLAGYGEEVVSVEAAVAPTDLSVSHLTYAEDEAIGSILATFSSIDADSSTFTYELAGGAGDDDNSMFEIDGDKLRLKTKLDFETKPELKIRLRSTDGTNLSLEKTFVITVTNVSEAPTPTDDDYDVPINYIAIVTTIDDGVLGNDIDSDGDTFTAELVTPPEHGTLEFNADGTFRYRPASDAVLGQSETFTYRVTDSNGLSSDATVTLHIAGPAASPFYNTTTPTDVSPGASPGATSSLDALAVINLLNANRGRISIPVLELPQTTPPTYYYDVNNDFVISSLDILAIYNFINARNRGGEGEGTKTAVAGVAAEVDQADLYDAALVDLSELPNKRK